MQSLNPNERPAAIPLASPAAPPAQCFMVCRDGRPFTATRLHDTLDQARVEAERLTRKEHATFLVFALVAECHPASAPVEWTTYLLNL